MSNYNNKYQISMSRQKLLDSSEIYVKSVIEKVPTRELEKKYNCSRQAIAYHVKKMKDIIKKANQVK